MTAIARIREKIAKDGFRRGDTMTVGRRLGLKLQWEIMDKSPMSGDVAWVRANRPDFEHDNILVDGVRITWERASG